MFFLQAVAVIASEHNSGIIMTTIVILTNFFILHLKVIKLLLLNKMSPIELYYYFIK